MQVFNALKISALAVSALALYTPLRAEKLEAKPFDKPSEYDFYLIAPDRRVEVEAYLTRIGELDQTIEGQNKEIQSIDGELKKVSTGSTKRKKTLEWSVIESATGYSVKVYDANKALLQTQTTQENVIILELDEGSYFFQVAAMTKFKTGTYSHMSPFKVSKGRHSASELKLEDQIEIIREKIKISERLRADYVSAIQKASLGSESAQTPAVEVTTVKEASYFVALDKKATPVKFSNLALIPGRDGKVTQPSDSTSPAATGSFLWGAGLLAGFQETNTDFFRMNFGIEAFLRYDKTFLKFLRPQLKLQSEYSPSKSTIFDSMMHTSLNLGIYYPFAITPKFSMVPSIGTGVNHFLVFATVGSSSVLQWGFMPALEFQYAMMQNLSIYLGAAVNLTYDTSGKFLTFVPFNVGLTRRF